MQWHTITRPGIDGTARVADTALPHYLGHGWTVVPEPEPAPTDQQASDDPPAVEDTTSPDAPAPTTGKRRRASQED